MEGLLLAAQQDATDFHIETVNMRMNPDKEIAPTFHTKIEPVEIETDSANSQHLNPSNLSS
eukprot:scaffold9944_cov52-Cyclotella_meneghiniana.AAC.1